MLWGVCIKMKFSVVTSVYENQKVKVMFVHLNRNQSNHKPDSRLLLTAGDCICSVSLVTVNVWVASASKRTRICCGTSWASKHSGLKRLLD
jgi:hypothetical protein